MRKFYDSDIYGNTETATAEKHPSRQTISMIRQFAASYHHASGLRVSADAMIIN